MRTIAWGLAAGLAVVTTACTVGDDQDTAVLDQASTSDASTGGTPGFYFLPSSAYSGTFDGSYATRLAIELYPAACDGSGAAGAPVYTWTTVAVVPAQERYRVVFTADASIGVADARCYRVVPTLDGQPLGYLDVAVLATGVAPAGFRKWKLGSGQSIAFRIENLDPDGDDVLSHVDNCPLDANPGQHDGDHDGTGDACDRCPVNPGKTEPGVCGCAVPDLDGDGDGVADCIDNCPAVVNEDQADADGDGIGDACDAGCVVIDSGVGAWTGDGTAEDSIYDADGAWTGAAAYAPAEVADGFSLGGSSYVRAPFSYSGGWTVQVWARAAVATPGSATGLIATGDAAATATTFQIEQSTTGNYRLVVGASGLIRNLGAASTAGFAHLVVSFDGSSGYIVYRDGVQVGAGTYAGAVELTTLKIGTNRATNHHFRGVLDDVRVWGRVLTANEVASIYAHGADGICGATACAPGSTTACYDGPAGTDGVGTCTAGTATCDASGAGYGACVGAVTPTDDACGDGLDNDCDGTSDEDCVCAPGSTAACYDGPPGTAGVGTCTPGAMTCNATGTGYGACVGAVTPTDDACGDGLDNDCDGTADETCVCAPGSSASCYTGPPGTNGVGACHAGAQTCNSAGSGYGACTGSVLPTSEVCGDAVDNDCDGLTDEGCIGDRAWNDIDHDGIQDLVEPGLPGVIFLLRSAATGSLISVQVSDAFGTYYFSGVPGGSYFIEAVLPFTFGLSSMDVGTDDELDSDFDGEAMSTAPFSFPSNGTIRTIDLGAYSTPGT